MDENELEEEDVEVVEEASVDELEDVRYVSDDLEEDKVDEFVKVRDKLLELEITANVVSICFLHSNRITHM